MNLNLREGQEVEFSKLGISELGGIEISGVLISEFLGRLGGLWNCKGREGFKISCHKILRERASLSFYYY